MGTILGMARDQGSKINFARDFPPSICSNLEVPRI